MLKKVYASTKAKKTTIFAAVFAITFIILGNKQLSMGDDLERLREAFSGFAQGQAAVAAMKPVNTMEETPYVVQLVSEEALAGVPTFPFSGEFPALQASPLPYKPNVLANLPTPNGFVYSANIPLSYELQLYTYNRCVEQQLDYELVLALMWRESRFQVDAVGNNTNGTQDSGIMQINDVNKEWLRNQYGIYDLMDPVQNIDAGTLMLSGLTSKYGIHDGLMAYQYGEAGMRVKQQQGIFTNDSIAKLLEKRADFRSILQQS